MTVTVLVGDCRELLRSLPDKSVNMVATSPPYWGLRDYKIPPSVWGGDPECKHDWAVTVLPSANGSTLPMAGKTKNQASATRSPQKSDFCAHCHAWRGCYGLEPTYQLYIEHTVEIFREVSRVLRDDGTLWLNLGDCYANSPAGWSAQRYKDEERDDRAFRDKPFNTFTRPQKKSQSFAREAGGTSPANAAFRPIDWGYRGRANADNAHKGRGAPARADGSEDNADRVNYGPAEQPNRTPQPGLKQKDLAGMPWRIAFALQDDGWFLRRDIIWHKKNPMPESVFDRPTTAHEYLFLFAKSNRTLCWRHESGRWSWTKPDPEWRWRHRVTRDVIAHEPPKWGKRDKIKNYPWFRFNLWRGFDYYYDFAAIMEPTSPDSHARAARSRSDQHKHSNGSDISGKPHGIAIGSPSAGRYPTPAGWDEGDGHHGSVHRDGRRQDVGIGHNSRPRKGVPNEAAGRCQRSGNRAGQTPASIKTALRARGKAKSTTATLSKAGRKTTLTMTPPRRRAMRSACRSSPTTAPARARRRRPTTDTLTPSAPATNSRCATSVRCGRSPPSRSRKRTSRPSRRR